MSARVRVALLALLTLAVAVGPVAAAVTPAQPPLSRATTDQTTATPTTVPTEQTNITIELRPDGDAAWTITTRLDVSSEERREAFRELADRYDDGRTTTSWIAAVRAANADAERATGRSMAIDGVRRTSNVSAGTLSLHFTWTNFAREEADRMVVGDAFNTTNGAWLGSLTGDQRLVIQLPEGYGVLDTPDGANPSSSGGSVSISWEGPQQFEPGYMHVEYSGDARPPNANPYEEMLLGGFVVVSLSAIAVGIYVFSRRRNGLPSPTLGTVNGSGPTTGGSASGEPADDGTDSETATAGTVEPANGEPDDDVDEELLSDEERVERLLERNGGRMKQANIVRETEWSNAKVSQLLSSMADEGTIDKLRIGRENLISFPDEDVTDVDQD